MSNRPIGLYVRFIAKKPLLSVSDTGKNFDDNMKSTVDAAMQWRRQKIFSGGAKIRGDLGDGSPPVGSRGEAPVGSLWAKPPRI